MIYGKNKVLIGWFRGLMDQINTSKRSKGLRIRFQLSTRVPTKVTTFWLDNWPLDEQFLKLKLKLKMISDDFFLKVDCSAW